jgi:hypothetical protein
MGGRVHLSPKTASVGKPAGCDNQRLYLGERRAAGCKPAGLRGCGAAGLRGCGAAGLRGCGAAGLRGDPGNGITFAYSEG